MAEVKHITPEQYGVVGLLVRLHNEMMEASRKPGLSLADKVLLQRRAKELYADALKIGA